jgi:hypothetical protein
MWVWVTMAGRLLFVHFRVSRALSVAVRYLIGVKRFDSFKAKNLGSSLCPGQRPGVYASTYAVSITRGLIGPYFQNAILNIEFQSVTDVN